MRITVSDLSNHSKSNYRHWRKVSAAMTADEMSESLNEKKSISPHYAPSSTHNNNNTNSNLLQQQQTVNYFSSPQQQQQKHLQLATPSPPLVTSSSISSPTLSSSQFPKMGSIDDCNAAPVDSFTGNHGGNNSTSNTSNNNSNYLSTSVPISVSGFNLNHNQAMANNGTEQNILFGSLPPVGTILNTSSFANYLSTDDNMANSPYDPIMTSFNDQLLGYYEKVDSTVLDDDDDLLDSTKCLPFGYFYHNEKLEQISSLPSSTTSSPALCGNVNDLFNDAIINIIDDDNKAAASNASMTISGAASNQLNQQQQQQQQQQQINQQQLLPNSDEDNFVDFSSDDMMMFENNNHNSHHSQLHNHNHPHHNHHHHHHSNQQHNSIFHLTASSQLPPNRLSPLMTCDSDPLISGNGIYGSPLSSSTCNTTAITTTTTAINGNSNTNNNNGKNGVFHRGNNNNITAEIRRLNSNNSVAAFADLNGTPSAPQIYVMTGGDEVVTLANNVSSANNAILLQNGHSYVSSSNCNSNCSSSSSNSSSSSCSSSNSNNSSNSSINGCGAGNRLKGSPMLSSTSDGPTLTQLNLQLPTKDDEEEMLSWINATNEQNFTKVTLPRNAALLPCGNAVDLNHHHHHQQQQQQQQQHHDQQQQQNHHQQQQQHNLISSSSSPTSKTFAINSNVIPNGNIPSTTNGNLSNIVTSTIHPTNGVAGGGEQYFEMVDDSSLEIESIFQQSSSPNGGCADVMLCDPNTSTMYHQLTSPPKICANLQFKSPISTIHKQQPHQQKIKRPNAVMLPAVAAVRRIPMSNGVGELRKTTAANTMPTLLGELLVSSNMNEILQNAGNSTATATTTMIAINGVNHSNLVPKQQQQQQPLSTSAATSTTNANLANGSINLIGDYNLNSGNNNGGGGGKSISNCPMLAKLITSPMISTPLNGKISSNMAAILASCNNNTTITGTTSNNNNNNNNRNRNNSMSTDYSVSSHDEGFASQPEEDQSESDDASDEVMLLSDPTDDNIDTEMYLIDGTINFNSITCDNGAQQLLPTQQPLAQQQHNFLSLTGGATDLATIDIGASKLFTIKQESHATTSSSSPSDEPMWNGAINNNNNSPIDLNQLRIKSESSPTSQLQLQQQPQHQSSSNSNNIVQQPLYQQQPPQLLKQHSIASSSAMTNDEDNDSVDDFEEDDDDDDESFYGDYDANDLLGATTSDDVNNKWSLNMGRSRKGSEKRFFWQYNVQSKGPKGPRYNSGANHHHHNSSGSSGNGSNGNLDSYGVDAEDPHVFNEISDPVFAPDCQVEGVKHSGKARRGDGNDLTPNPKKLLMIGLELKKLSKTINDLMPVTEVPFPCRNKSRKEKNKLASRACRLKKKAQHEANKIKLHGLYREHSKLVKIIADVRKVLLHGIKMKDSNEKPISIALDGICYQLRSVAGLSACVDQVIARQKPLREISGRTAEFVNHVLDNVSAGVANGGIENV